MQRKQHFIISFLVTIVTATLYGFCKYFSSIMIPEVQSFFENYGWYMVLGFIVYLLLIKPYISNIQQQRALINQKKYDEQIDAKHQEKIEAARLRMQAEYEEERKRAKEKESQIPKTTKSLDFDPLAYIQSKVNRKPVVVFSKTTCPYCRKAKQILSTYRLSPDDYEIIELDQLKHCDEIQSALGSLTGARTVPRVFIKGDCIGGCDDTAQAHKEGRIEKLLTIANVNFYQ